MVDSTFYKKNRTQIIMIFMIDAGKILTNHNHHKNLRSNKIEIQVQFLNIEISYSKSEI